MRRYSLIPALLFAILAFVTTNAYAAFRWEKESATPPLSPDATIGTSNGAILVVDGKSQDGTIDTGIHFLAPGKTEWAQTNALKTPRSGSAAASDGKSMFCIGGANGDTISADVSQLTFEPATASVQEKLLPPLPVPLNQPAATMLGKRLYVIGFGSKSDARALLLDLSAPSPAWQVVVPPEGLLSGTLALVTQGDGDIKKLYLFCSGNGAGKPSAFAMDVARNTWHSLAPPPLIADSICAVASGQAHILVGAGKSLLQYHTITDTWISADAADINFARLTSLDSTPVVISHSGEMFHGKANSTGSHFRWPDYLALIAYPIILILAGVFLRVKDESNSDEYFRGGKRIPWWAAGLSLVATQVSAIGFVAIPAKTFATDWIYFAGIASWFVVAPIVTRKFIPLFQRMNVTTAYEYLEGRYNFPMRMVASLLFMAIQVTRASVVLYLPAIALSALTGVDRIWCILVMGAVTTVYTVMGGMQTVIWTDVLQAVALLGGALLCVVIVLIDVGGIRPFFSTAIADGKFAMVSDGWSMSGPSLWIVFFGGIFARLASLVSDQNVVQRYQSTSSAEQASRALWADVAVSIPWAFTIFLLGTALYVFFKFNPGLLDPTMDTDQIVPMFIAQRVPVGLAGLVVAAIFAASLDGSMLAVATTFVNDVYGRLRPATAPRARVVLAKGMTIALGLFATGIGVLLAVSDIRSLWDLAIQMSGLFTGALAALFILGMFFPRVGTGAAFAGFIASGIAMYFVETRSLVHVLFYAGVGVSTSVIVSLLASLVLPRRFSSHGMADETLASPEHPLISPAQV